MSASASKRETSSSVLGPSGSGKTTLLRCLNFLERADGGVMDFHGVHLSLAEASHRAVADVRKKTGICLSELQPLCQ